MDFKIIPQVTLDKDCLEPESVVLDFSLANFLFHFFNFSHGITLIRIKYDCCPGFKRSDIINNECVEVDRTYLPIVPTLELMNKNKTANKLALAEPNLAKDDQNKDFTVFVPDKDGSLPNSSPDAPKSIIADGRHYAQDFIDGTTIPVKNGLPLKVSTYPNNVSTK
ncbi:unnamed protein product [Dibothriocephalus latus]|uniref:Uncharacterized protein n=1 Tax=Dibothriocephalus latus TaxID=60516 RepID=A0A3P7M782_DIBLA|nr:unnamed protein product [Dibothriocephalus latus]